MNTLIIIPHYGSNEHLAKLLPTLGVEYPGDEALDNTSLVIPFKHGEIYIWNNNLRNLGFTKACNEGIRYAMNIGFDIVWLLNNDTTVENIDLAILSLYEEFTSNPKTGVVGFKILSMDDPDFIHHGGTGVAFPAGAHKVGYVSQGNFDKRTKEGWVTGASMAISSGCILDCGCMDERFVNYGSDSDFCYTARSKGFDVVYLPIPIQHKIGQSARPSQEQIVVIKGDMLYFANKWINGKLYHDLSSETF